MNDYWREVAESARDEPDLPQLGIFERLLYVAVGILILFGPLVLGALVFCLGVVAILWALASL